MAADRFSNLLSTQALAIDPPRLREITLKVAAVNGINLGQGVCLLPVPEAVKRAAHRAIDAGINRYTNPRGLPELRKAIAEKLLRHNGLTVDPESELLITCGSTGAFEALCAAILNPGDEVVCFAPFYPYHRNTLRRFGAKISYVELQPPDWSFSMPALETAISPHTKLLLINTPANPTGKVFTAEELNCIGELAARHDVLVVTDEIYEYMTYDGARHISPATIPSLRDRTITIGGYSKTFAITGWRIGYMALPAELSTVITPILDSIYICPPAPLQRAVADALSELGGEFYCRLAGEYRAKRDYFAAALREAGLKPFPTQGTYYMMADFSERFPQYNADEFVDHMIKTARVGAVPAADFVPESAGATWMRFCFAVPDEMLERAAENLKALR